MYNRLYAHHLSEHNLLFERHTGFRVGFSTEHDLTEFVERLLDSFDQNLYTLGIFIDLLKAFDTVNHTILF